MKTTFVSSVLLSLTLLVYGQEEIDSSSWELVIPDKNISKLRIKGNTVSLDRDDLLSLPGGQEDPSRLLMKFPGFTSFNEKNNGIVFRGMPSHFSGWSINGAEILNPNHTIGFQDLFSAGNLNSISSQVVSNYAYHSNPDSNLGASYIAGTSDITLRTPYRNQLNLNLSHLQKEIGVDFKKNKLSLLTNYRSSSNPILKALKLKEDKDSLSYQDFVAKLKYSNPQGWNFELFHLNGINTERQVNSGGSSSRYTENKKSILTSGISVNKKTQEFVFASSTNLSKNIIEYFSFFNEEEYYRGDTISLLSNTTRFSKLYDKTRMNYSLKMSLSNYLYDTDSSSSNPKLNILIQPGISVEHRLSSGLFFNTGFHYNYFKQDQDGINEKSFSPNAGIGWITNDGRFNFSGKYAFVQQFQNNSHYYLAFHFPKAHNISFEVTDNESNLTAILFSHSINSLLQNRFGFQYLSILNDQSLLTFGDFSSYQDTSSVNIQGLSLNYFEEINTSTSLTGNITVLHGSQYFAFDSLSSIPSGYAKIPLLSNLISNITFTKKQLWCENLEVIASTHYRSGRNHKENYDDSFDKKIPHYFRGDLRINYHFREKGRRYRSLLSLDIQNITNRRNSFSYIYDREERDFVLEKGRGIRSTLSWRIVL